MHKLIFTAALALVGSSCAAPDAITYDDVAGRPREERLATLGRATDAERAAIIRTHYARVAAGPDVPTTDRAALARLVELVPEGDDAVASGEAERLMRGLGASTIRAVLALGGEGP